MLVDTGADDLGPKTGKLFQNLRAEGISPSDIDVVVLTHAHPDHIGGNTSKDGKLAFPNARFFIWKDEFDFWISEKAEQKLNQHSKELLLTLARKNLQPIQDQLNLIDQEIEILPGIRAVAAPGHTPGHMALAISSKRENNGGGRRSAGKRCRLTNCHEIENHELSFKCPDCVNPQGSKSNLF